MAVGFKVENRFFDVITGYQLEKLTLLFLSLEENPQAVVGFEIQIFFLEEEFFEDLLGGFLQELVFC